MKKNNLIKGVLALSVVLLSSFSLGTSVKAQETIPEISCVSEESSTTWWIGEDGKITEVENIREPGISTFCNHDIVKGVVTVHTKTGAGCISRIHNGEQCKKCGDIWINELINTITWEICPH